MPTQFVVYPGPDVSDVYSEEEKLLFYGEALNASVLHIGLVPPNALTIIQDPEPFVLDDRLQSLLPSFLEFLRVQFPHKRFTDGATVRLHRLIQNSTSNRLTIYTRRASYFQYLVTGWACSQNYAIRDNEGREIPFRSIVEPGPTLSPFDVAKASNHIGVQCLLLCDQKLLMSQRGAKQVTDAGLLGLSASGVLDDEGEKTSPFRQALRELEEEMGIGAEHLNLESIHLIGIVREFARAGKPEMYVLVKAKSGTEELDSLISSKKGIDSWESAAHSWLALDEPNAIQDVSAHYRLQPSARIGLYLLDNLLHTRAIRL